MPLSVPQARFRRNWLVLFAAIFLVSVPVFIQAPLVRQLPWLSLGLTFGLVSFSLWLRSRSASFVWGDLLIGFSWTWLAGSVYWGWLRWEPYWHLPVEAIGLPFVTFGLIKGWGKVGGWFYIGSLLGTALTDAYFYWVDLIPYWRQVMQATPETVQPIFQAAVAQVQTPWGVSAAIALATVLLVAGSLPLRSSQLHWWAFGGAVLSTIFVDSLFWFAATIA